MAFGFSNLNNTIHLFFSSMNKIFQYTEFTVTLSALHHSTWRMVNSTECQVIVNIGFTKYQLHSQLTIQYLCFGLGKLHGECYAVEMVWIRLQNIGV